MNLVLDITTPALLFPAISLLFLGYTNRFLSTGQLIRSLGASIKAKKGIKIKEQISNLKKRMELIRWMQFYGVISMLFCIVSMASLFFNYYMFGCVLFVLSMLTMCASLCFSIYEIFISTEALKIELRGL